MSDNLEQELLTESKLSDDQIKDIWNGVNVTHTLFAKRLNNGKGLPVLVKLEKIKTSDRVIKSQQGRMYVLKAYKAKDNTSSWYLEEYNVTFGNNSTQKGREAITNESAKRILDALGMSSYYKEFTELKDATNVPEFKTVKSYIKEGVDFNAYINSLGEK